MKKILQTPSITSIQAFDPLFEKKIEFIYTDNQSVRNRAVITDNMTNQIVYDVTQDNMRLYHVIPAGSLRAGTQYLIQIQVFDADGNASNLSDSVLVYCFSTPVFTFSNITDGQEYKNASISLNLKYEQSEGEALKNFQFLQYSYDKTLLSSSGVYYSSAAQNFTFYGLENNTTYYFRAIGETNHGMVLDTDYISVNVSYQVIPANVICYLQNDKRSGYIGIRMNIIDVGYQLENDNYLLQDGMLTLFDNSLTYNSGFEADGDFILFVEAKHLPLKKFLTVNDDIFSLGITKICRQYYCALHVKNTNIIQYVPLPKARLATESNDIIYTDSEQQIEIINTDYENDDLVVFEVKRVNGVYGLRVYYKAEMLKE